MSDKNPEIESVSQNNKQKLIQNFSNPVCFPEWPNPNDPAVVAGIYDGLGEGQLLYAGMSDSNIEKQHLKKKYGSVNPLEGHTKKRLSGRGKLIL